MSGHEVVVDVPVHVPAIRARGGAPASQYARLFEGQQGACAACRRGETLVDRAGAPLPLVYYHCALRGTVRALLCRRCEAVLSLVGDDPEVLTNLVGLLFSGVRRRELAVTRP